MKSKAHQLFPFIIFFTALTFSFLWCFVIYPFLATPYDIPLELDGWAELGRGIWKFHTLSYYPDAQPTIQRGPIYPLFIAILIVASNDFWPYCVQAGQCFLFAATCATVYWIGKTLRNATTGMLSAVICLFHPFLVWYTSRILLESLTIFLVTALTASTLKLSLFPTKTSAVFVGLILGILALAKTTFLPLVFLVPFLFVYLMKPSLNPRLALCIFAAAMSLILPWTARNWNLTHKIIPIHLLIGYNFQRGDDFADHFFESPLKYEMLWKLSEQQNPFFNSDSHSAQKSFSESRWESELQHDQKTLQASLQRYFHHPSFLFKKMITNAWTFWMLGSKQKSSTLFIFIQIPLFVLFSLHFFRLAQKKQLQSIQGLHTLIVFLYFLIHLPVYAIARFSVVLIPTMITYSVIYISQNGKLCDKSIITKDDKNLTLFNNEGAPS